MSQQRGFTLVELSIVLVILGLLVGGVLTGQSLIRASELRKVSSDFQRYQSAIYTFKDKYFALPGDMPNAVRYWGAAAGPTTDGANATCAAVTTATSGTTTCNGNGDGSIAGNATGIFENYRSWQHLANAGLIEGRYSGVPTTTGDGTAVAGVNVPKSPIGQAYYALPAYDLNNLATMAPTANTPGSAQYIELVTAGLDPGNLDMVEAGGVLTMQDAYNIDKKMDDGVANTGKVRADVWDPGNSTDEPGTCHSYVLTTTTAGRCALALQY